MATNHFDQFTGTDKYIVSPELRDVVNVAIALQRPLIVKGEPGTGKTLLAHNIAQALDKPLLVWNIKSTTNDHGRIERCAIQHHGNHRSGRGLAVGSGNSDSVFQPHELS